MPTTDLRTEPVTPMFLFSLPRSGSTLLQRVLAAHPLVATASEPWVLLPLLYTLRGEGVYSEYGHYLSVRGVRDFCSALPGGEADYRAALAEMVLGLYTRACRAGERYFLDKTPRYHLVSEEIAEMFPQAPLLVLWRNPLAVIASMAESFGRGRWMLYVLKIDLHEGLDRLISLRDRYRDRCIEVRYEALVRDPRAGVEQLLARLGLAPHPELLEAFRDVELSGALGDRHGTRAYREITEEPVEKWRTVLNNPLRKAWCRRYLRRLGAGRLQAMGYDLDALLADLAAAPTTYRHFASDLLQMAFAPVYDWLEPAILRDKLRLAPRWRRIVGHR